MANITQLITRTKAAVHYAVNLPEDADASEHSTMYWVSEPGLGKTSGLTSVALIGSRITLTGRGP